MKKVLVYCLLTVILFNSAGCYLLFELHKYQIKKEMKAIIQSNPANFTILKIDDVENDKEFRWVHKKEFRYKGSMYDIVRMKKNGNTTVFICIHDTRESKLFAGLQRETENKRHVALLDQVVLFFSPYPVFQITTAQMAELIFPVIHVALTTPLLIPWYPPPKFS